MHEFLAGMIVGGTIGMVIAALCVAAAGRERDDG
jgi:gas vesicle protein